MQIGTKVSVIKALELSYERFLGKTGTIIQVLDNDNSYPYKVQFSDKTTDYFSPLELQDQGGSTKVVTKAKNKPGRRA